jgi:multisubunit Na+/H+ antiporter MnhE subunit
MSGLIAPRVFADSRTRVVISPATTARTRSPGTPLIDVARDYPDVHFHAINLNDADRYPHDPVEAMRERVNSDGTRRTGPFTRKARICGPF